MALAIGEFLAEALLTSMSERLIETISDGSKYNPNDSEYIQFLKRRAQTGDANRQWRKRERKLIIAREKFIKAIKSIVDQSIPDDDSKHETKHIELFKAALKMLENGETTKLAKVIFDRDQRWMNYTIDSLKTAHDGFIQCWLNKDDVHFFYRLSALRMAFYCDVYQRLFIDKNLKKLEIDVYWAYLLPEIAKCIRKPNAVQRRMLQCIRKGDDECNDQVKFFVKDILRFTNASTYAIIRRALDEQPSLQHLGVDKLNKDQEKAVNAWLTNERDGLSSPLLQPLKIVIKPIAMAESIIKQPLTIVIKPMAMAESIIKEIYRKRFKQYNPFHFDLGGYHFDMDSWIPIVVRRVYGTGEHKTYFQLIKDRLDNSHLAVITGVPGSGKTLLVQKIAFDYATGKSEDENRWDQYDFVLLAEFRSTSDKKHETIIDLAMCGMERFGAKKNLCEFIKENVEKCKVLIILDGYDEAVHGQCQQLSDMLNIIDTNWSTYSSAARLHGQKEARRLSSGAVAAQGKQLPFDLIVTGRPTGVLKRKENGCFLKVIGFGTKEKREYIEKHYANHENKAMVNKLIEQIENDTVYRKMAATPLMLTFICSVYSQLKTTTRVELYENVVFWLIRQKLNVFPNLLAELASSDSAFFGTKCDMTADDIKAISENWISLEQIKRLGFISLSLLTNNKYQFDSKELQNVQLNMNINVFKKIGLIIGNAERSFGNAEESNENTEESIDNQTSKYQFAHRTLQEYFAAMFMTKWEDEYRKKETELMQKMYDQKEMPVFFVELLLTRREKKLNESAIQYLMNARSICFNIKSNDSNEHLHQLKYINNILDECQNIARVHINLNKMTVTDTIELRFLSKNNDIVLIISDGIFEDNHLNMISIDAGNNLVNITFNHCQFSCSRLMKFAAFVNENVQQFRRTNPMRTEFNKNTRKKRVPILNDNEATATSSWASNTNWEWIRNRLSLIVTFKSTDQSPTNTSASTNPNPKKPSSTNQNPNISASVNQNKNKSESNNQNQNKSSSINHDVNKLKSTNQKTNKISRKINKRAGIKFYIGNETIIDVENIGKLENVYQQYDGRLEIRSLTSLRLTALAMSSILQSFSCIRSLDLRLPQPEIIYDESVEKSIDNISVLSHLRYLKLYVRKSYENVSIGKTNWNYINKLLQKCPKIRSIIIWLRCNTIDEPIDLQFLPIEDDIVDVEIHDGVFKDNDSNMIYIGGAKRIELAFYRRHYPHNRLMAFAKFADENAQMFTRIQFFTVENNQSMLKLVAKQFKNIEFRHKSKKKKGAENYSSFYTVQRKVR